MLKLNRNYQIKFTIGKVEGITKSDPDETIIVEYPFTMMFDIDRNYLSTNNTALIQILNLNDVTRAKLHKDKGDFTRYIDMEVYAGYGDDLPLIFIGRVMTASSMKASGSTDIVTEIEAWDGGFIQSSSYTSMSYDKNVTINDVLQSVVASNLAWVKQGVIIPLPYRITQRGRTYIGNTWDIITRVTNHQAFIDNGIINVLAENDILADEINVINADTGLLATPARRNSMLIAEIMFEPHIKVCQGVYLESQTAQYYNQIYKVLGVQHKGIISPVANGKTTTTLTLASGTFVQQSKQPEQVISSDTKWIKPVEAPVTSSFGYRTHPITGKRSFHEGIDYGCSLGTPVKATNSGTVAGANLQGGYGNVVVINHGQLDGKTMSSKYGHLQSFVVNVNDKVSQGQVIGYSGGQPGVASSGASTGPHLHFEIRENGNPVNPTKYVGN